MGSRLNVKGPPDEAGDVEIGWGVSEDRRRLGYAFEATTGSQRLARKLGMAETMHSRRDLPLWTRPRFCV